jgi:hypothetical protein
MKTLSIAAILLASLSTSGLAQPQHANQPKASQPPQTNAQWAKHYAPNCAASYNSCNGAGINPDDPHFLALLRHSLPQSDSWWVNGYGGHSSVTNAVLAFLGIPEATFFDDNRYLTATGCVPHVCTSKGMLWIDTGTRPATMIFVGEDLVAGGQRGESGYHLYLYPSREITTYYAGKRHIEMFDPQFLKSLARWHEASISRYDNQKIILATIVWPNGRTHDLFWSDLLQPPPVPANNTGAKP